MRKSIWTVLFTALVALAAVSCAKETDLTEVKSKIDDLDKRVTALEQAVEKINKETVPGFENLVKALNEKLTVVSVTESTAGCVIAWSDGTTSVITNGKDGKDGQDGQDGQDGEDGEDGKDAQAPEINITFIDGVYYWTVNGELLKDGDGNPIPVTGKGDKGDKGDQGDKGDKGDQGDPGVDGITPLFGTSSEGKVIVSYDDGETWKPLGFSVIDGSAFTSAYIDDEKSTEDYIVLVVGETEVQIPKEKNFALKINYEGDLSSVGANAGDNISLEYVVEGASATDDVTVDVLSATAGITAKIVKVDALTGYILIGIPAADPEADPAEVSGKIFVFADNNKGKTNIKVISLEEGTITAVADVTAQVPAAGGEIPLTVTTNKEYNVNISDGAETWLHVVDTKATHVDELNIVADPNTTGAYRVGVVSINDRATGELIEEFNVVQEPAEDVATEIASVRALDDDAPAFVKDAIVLAASKDGILVGDVDLAYIYVPVEDNTEIKRGDIVSFAGVKKTDEVTGIKYVETDAVEVGEVAAEIPDLAITYYGVAAQQGGSTSIHTTFVANIVKDAETEQFIAVPFYGDKFIIEDPDDALDIADYEDKLVAIEGYSNGGVSAEYWYNFIVTGIKELSYSVTPDWTLSFEDGVLSNTTSGEGASEWYGFVVVPAAAVGPEGDYETVEELIQDSFPYYQDEVQYNLLYYYAAYVANYGPELIISALMDDVIVKGNNSVNGIPYGDYIAFAYGLEDGTYNLTGHYATLEFTYEDPHVPAEYSDFIGEWTVGSKVWTIEAKDENEKSYTVSGFGKGDMSDMKATALFEDGKFVLPEQAYDMEYAGQYGTLSPVCLSGQFVSDGYIYNGYGESDEEPGIILTVGKLSDGTFDVTPGSSAAQNVTFTYFGFCGILIDGNYAGYTETIDYTIMPKSFAPYVPAPEIPSIFSEDFEDPSTLGGWAAIDYDGDGKNWSYSNSQSTTHSGDAVMTSASYSGGALTPDNWLITPAIEFTTGNYLSYWVCAQDPDWPEEKYGVYITETEPASLTLENLTQLHVETLSSGEMQNRVFAIPAAFENKPAYIVFRHFDCTDMFRMNLDDVVVYTANPAASSVSYAPASAAAQPTVKTGKHAKITNKVSAAVRRNVQSPAAVTSLNKGNVAGPVQKTLSDFSDRRK